MYILKKKIFLCARRWNKPCITVDESKDKKTFERQNHKGDCHGRMRQRHGLAMTGERQDCFAYVRSD